MAQIVGMSLGDLPGLHSQETGANLGCDENIADIRAEIVNRESHCSISYFGAVRELKQEKLLPEQYKQRPSHWFSWREYHDRNPAALPLVGTVEGFLPGFTSSVGREYHDRNLAALPLVGIVQGFLPGFTS